MMCGVSVSLLRLMVGVLGKAPEIVLRARRWTFSSNLQFRCVSRALTQTVHAYVRIGLTTAVYIHLHILGLRPQDVRIALRHCISEIVALRVIWSM